MNSFTGHLDKMRTAIGDPVNYRLPLDELEIPMNELVGRRISLSYSGKIHCTACGRKIRKSYSDGHCWPCTQSLASCDFCILKPETCHYDEGTCREPSWGEANCMTPHYVYLANSSGLKVGITRHVNVPTRWIDQGAHQALPIMMVQTRLQSGVMETIFKQHVSDRTDWRKMLRNDVTDMDLAARRDELIELCEEEIADFQDRFGADSVEIIEDAEVVSLSYPVMTWPVKVKSMNFDKMPVIEGVLQGIKGQYLIFDCGVINIRKFSSYEVTLTI